MCEQAGAQAGSRRAVGSRHQGLRVVVEVLSFVLALAVSARGATPDVAAAALSSIGAGAYLVKDIQPTGWANTPDRLTAVGATLFFTLNDGLHGSELWKSDGTAAGTVMVRDICPGPDGAFPWDLTAVGGTLFFSADDGMHGRELWRSDGTESGTVMVKDVRPGPLGAGAVLPTAVGSELFFWPDDGVHGRELWKSDGTEWGTVFVKDTNSGPTSGHPEASTAVDQNLFFTLREGQELWRSDGTESGTVMVRDIGPAVVTVCFEHLTAVGETLFFAFDDRVHGSELWKSDGTESGTVMVKDIQSGAAGSSPSFLMARGGTLFFQGDDGAHGFELWKSDGTEPGTVMVRDIQSGAGSSFAAPSAAASGMLFLMANDGVHGSELWRSDGTESGTVMVKDILPGPNTPAFWFLTAGGDTVFMGAFDGVHGRELWKSDGTESGTVMVQDVNPGWASSDTTGGAAAGGRFFFTAADSLHGTDLWAVGLPVALRLSPYFLRFGAVTSGGAVRATTPAQRVEVNALVRPLSWSVSADEPWLKVSGGAGTGTGTFTVGVDPRALPLGGTGVERGSVTIETSGAVARSQTMEVQVDIYPAGSTAEPTGNLDTPADGAAVSGAIPVTGWAVDDIAADVAIYRDPVPSDPAGAISPNGKVYVGPGNFVPGTRPDVESLFVSYPQARRAGWGHLLLTNALPDLGSGALVGGNGRFVLHAYASDLEGHTTLLGSTAITADNASATRPFGTIDVPGQGESVSGTAVVFGWALTPPPGEIPKDGSTIGLVIDGQLMGHPVYNQYRSEIADLFPGYANSNGAVGYTVLDTTTMTNGMHTIEWRVADDLARAEGIGSRFFWVQN